MIPIGAHPSLLDRWFTTIELLSRFPAWYELAHDQIEWLWAGQGADHLWDFGPRSSASHYFPLSSSWRKPINRKIDWSARILLLLSKFDIKHT